jgi:hypothetical protein
MHPDPVAGTRQHDMLSGGYRRDDREVRGVEQRSGRVHLRRRGMLEGQSQTGREGDCTNLRFAG